MKKHGLKNGISESDDDVIHESEPIQTEDSTVPILGSQPVHKKHFSIDFNPQLTMKKEVQVAHKRLQSQNFGAQPESLENMSEAEYQIALLKDQYCRKPQVQNVKKQTIMLLSNDELSSSSSDSSFIDLEKMKKAGTKERIRIEVQKYLKENCVE